MVTSTPFPQALLRTQQPTGDKATLLDSFALSQRFQVLFPLLECLMLLVLRFCVQRRPTRAWQAQTESACSWTQATACPGKTCTSFWAASSAHPFLERKSEKHRWMRP